VLENPTEKKKTSNTVYWKKLDKSTVAVKESIAQFHFVLVSLIRMEESVGKNSTCQ
jgi:hypothetical protein